MKPRRLVMAVWGLAVALAPSARGGDGDEVKLADCPAAVQKTLRSEARGAAIVAVTKKVEKDDEEVEQAGKEVDRGRTVYWADVAIGGKAYSVRVAADGTLYDMILDIGPKEVPFADCPAAVQETFRREAFGTKVDALAKSMVGADLVYEARIEHKGHPYEVSVAEDGTLIAKVIDKVDGLVELGTCPPAVQKWFRENYGLVPKDQVARGAGVLRAVYRGTVTVDKKNYVVEIDGAGALISKQLLPFFEIIQPEKGVPRR
jgi:hypothetical protein